MKPFRTHTGAVVPLDRANVDTDQIIPKQFLKRIERTGFGEFLFYDWRFKPGGELDDYGFRAIFVTLFADIFANNCMKNGLLPIVLSESDVRGIFERASSEG